MSVEHLRRFLGIFSLLGCLTSGYSQDYSRTGSGSLNRVPSDFPDESRTQEDYVGSLDTFGIFKFYSNNIHEERPFSDSTLMGYYHHYDPARMQDYDYLTLGNTGSAAIPYLYKPVFRKGFDVGLHQYDLYYTFSKDMPYYRLEKPFTNVAFNQLGDQSDTYFTGEFSRNFANGLNLSLDYKKISLIGNQNHFPNQNSRNTAIGLGMWFHSKRNYNGLFAFTANTAEQENNGGLKTPPRAGGDFLTSNSAEVFLEDAVSRHSHRELSYTHFFQIGGKPDSLKGAKRAFDISHEIKFQNSQYRYSDTIATSLPTAADSSYYGDFLNYHRGVRFFLQHRKIENTFRLSTFKLRQQHENLPADQKDLVEIGLTHSIHYLDFEQKDSTINNLFLFGKLDFRPNQQLKINTYGHLGLLDNRGDLRLSGSIYLDFKKFGNLEAGIINQLNTPNLIQSRFIVNQEEIWKNSFKKVFENNIWATYNIPALELSINGQYHLINNAVYFDQKGISRQTGVPISILQLSIQKNFTLGKFHLDNVLSIQQISEPLIRLPELYGKHSAYYLGKWFKVLNVRLGLDVRYQNEYKAYYYQPLTGQFQLQDEFTTPFFPNLDAYLSMRVTKFRAYVKWENLLNTIQPDRFYYQIAYYASWAGGLRIGIKWRFVN